MDNLVKHVIVLGGGTAGWMTAAYLSKAFEGQIQVTVIEAESIPRIGVGEATVPNLQRAFFDFLGIPETEWMRHCNASFKSAVKFVNWQQAPVNGVDNHFYHLFGQLRNCDHASLAQYWVLKKQLGSVEPLDYACHKDAPALDAKRSPSMMDGTPVLSHAWHMDAQLLADYLKGWSIARGVDHILDTLQSVTLDERGFIDRLQMQSGASYGADLFVDCSGFRGLLINQALGEPFIDMSDQLLCDSAVAANVPSHDERDGVEPYTSAIALKHGWVWKIPMLGRFGTGYVFSSSFTSMDEATEEFAQLWNLDVATTPLNKIRFRVGRNRRAWVKNCVSIGLSSCFLEPLESTGIYFIHTAIYLLAKHFPDKSFHPILLKRFNEELEMVFDDSRDFIQAHYFPTLRDDTPFWRANRHELRLTDSLLSKSEVYKAGLPVNLVSDVDTYYDSFETEFHTFWTNSSYYYVWAGLGYLPDEPMARLRYQPHSRQKAEVMFASLKDETAQLLGRLPSLYQYLYHVHRQTGPGHDLGAAASGSGT